MDLQSKKEEIQAALGEIQADLVIKNAQVLNVFTERFEKSDVAVKNGMIVGIGQYSGANEINAEGKYLVPGFIDSHMHLESSIVSPKQYCKTVVPHGTTAVIADPHEITNVLGKVGFRYILEETKSLPLDVYLMVPSCVPASPFDESGATITSDDVQELLREPNVLGLAEMMNYPGVIHCDDEVLNKILAAQDKAMSIDGHAPGLSDKELNAYITSGVQSDHECTTIDEALAKISRGQWVMIREGSACKNLLDLIELFNKPYCDRCMLVTDDKHLEDLRQEGHIDHIIRKAIRNGANPIHAFKMASFNAATYFGLSKNGAVSAGYYADFVILDDVDSVKIHSVYKHGKRIDDTIDSVVDSLALKNYNPYSSQVSDTIHIPTITEADFALKKSQEKVIGLVSHQILTTDEGYASEIDVSKDICKLAVIERHHHTGNIGVAFVKGYGLKSGAIATSIAHDSHNIIVVGTNEKDMAFAVSKIKEMQGGIIVVENETVQAGLPLPIAGLMCDTDINTLKKQTQDIRTAAYRQGVYQNIAPFMTLSFSSLAVIPTLRLTTKGVVDVTQFKLLD